MIETAAIVAVVVGLVQVIKTAGVPSQFSALVSIVLGVAAAFAVAPEVSVGLTVFNGVIYGLSASGLYSGTRATLRF